MCINNQVIQKINIKHLGIETYSQTYNTMRNFTYNRTPQTVDEIWLVEHYPIFTQGKTGKVEHLLQISEIPVIQTDRGGQITYHAPGQQIMYILLDLKRRKLAVRQVVSFLENSVINSLSTYNVKAYAKADAPGVYVNNQKICSLGLHIYRGCTSHGLALNIDMDLSPFSYINPCGHTGLQMTRLKEFVNNIDRQQITQLLINNFTKQLING